MALLNEKISIAPMVDWTDPHFRMLMRGITRKTVLYTEMIVDDTVINTPSLDFMIGRDVDPEPSVIQLGGSNPETLAKAVEMCEEYSQGRYGEINLNCGCPSQRVAKKCFGAKLMMQPELVREIVHQMQRRASVPITVKCRIGVDEQDSYPQLTHFIRCAHEGGAQKFIIHARKCILNGLTTKQNREIPPLHYEVVHRLAQDFADLTFVINGGIQTFDQATDHFSEYDFRLSSSTLSPLLPLYRSNTIFSTGTANPIVPITSDAFVATDSSQVPITSDTVVVTDSGLNFNTSDASIMQNLQQELGEKLPGIHGAMIGRAAYLNPLLFATADSTFYGVKDPCLTRRQILERYMDYCDWCQSVDGPKRIVQANKELKEQKTSTMILLNAMRNVINGIKNVNAYRQKLNDEYMTRVKKTTSPSPREIIEESLQVISDEDLDAPLGNPEIYSIDV